MKYDVLDNGLRNGKKALEALPGGDIREVSHEAALPSLSSEADAIVLKKQ